MEKLNNYSEIHNEYNKSSLKPDKAFSMLPTILEMAGDVRNKTVLDLGCGNGFFTTAFADKGAKQVRGIDNSSDQIMVANKVASRKNIIYEMADIFKDDLSKADIIVAPYVLNYVENNSELEGLLGKIYQSLSEGGNFLSIVDLPEGKDLKKFGAIKMVSGEKTDGAKIKIELYNDGKLLCNLNAFYFTPKTITEILGKVGFKEIKWHKPHISKEGLEKMGKDFWEGYQNSPELGYVSAKK